MDEVIKTRSMALVHSQVEISNAGAGVVQAAMFNVSLDDFYQADVCPIKFTHVRIDDRVEMCLGAHIMGISDSAMACTWPDLPKPNRACGKRYDFDQPADDHDGPPFCVLEEEMPTRSLPMAETVEAPVFVPAPTSSSSADAESRVWHRPYYCDLGVQVVNDVTPVDVVTPVDDVARDPVDDVSPVD